MQSFLGPLPVLVVALANLASGRAGPDPFERARALILQKLDQHEAPSIAVAVARDGQILWEEAFGYADKEQKRRATANTPYRLGSTSKPITATAIMVLRDRGLLDVDRPVNDYLPEPKLRAAIGDISGATVRRVIQHTAGLPEYSEAYYRDEPGQVPSLDLAIRRYGVLMRPPGETFIYSNIGYAILGGVIAHVSRKSYGDFLHDEIFAPLGITHAAVAGERLAATRAIGYLADGGPVVEFSRAYVPAADVYASAHDLALFGLLHLKARQAKQRAILRAETIDEMQTDTVPMGYAAYGLGWHIRTDSKGRRQVLHGGASDGADAQFTLVPDQKLCVVALANVTRRWPGAVTEAVTNAILATVLGGEPTDFPTLQPDPPPKGSGLPGKLHGKWSGTVHTHQGTSVVTLWCQPDGEVRAELGNQGITSIRAAKLVTGTFTGKMDGQIATDDARRRPHELEWNATLRGNTLSGILYATAKSTNRPLRLGFWVKLHRAGSPQASGGKSP
jgi:CubicO group peptidase (beta-lactamase class C family)